MGVLRWRWCLFFVGCALVCDSIAAQPLSLLAAPLSSAAVEGSMSTTGSTSIVQISAPSPSTFSSFTWTSDSLQPPILSTDDFPDTCFSFAYLDDDDKGGDDTTPAFQLEVDTTILNESVSTFSEAKQWNLRAAFAVLLRVTSSDVAILWMLDVNSLQRARTLVSAGVNVGVGVQFITSTDVQQALNAVVAMFEDGSLAAYMAQLGTPVEMTLNSVRIDEEGDTGTGAGDDDDGDANLTTSPDESKASGAPVIAGALGGAAGFVILVVLFVKRGAIAPHVFTRVVPARQ